MCCLRRLPSPIVLIQTHTLAHSHSCTPTQSCCCTPHTNIHVSPSDLQPHSEQLHTHTVTHIHTYTHARTHSHTQSHIQLHIQAHALSPAHRHSQCNHNSPLHAKMYCVCTLWHLYSCNHIAPVGAGHQHTQAAQPGPLRCRPAWLLIRRRCHPHRPHSPAPGDPPLLNPARHAVPVSTDPLGDPPPDPARQLFVAGVERCCIFLLYSSTVRQQAGH